MIIKEYIFCMHIPCICYYVFRFAIRCLIWYLSSDLRLYNTLFDDSLHQASSKRYYSFIVIVVMSFCCSIVGKVNKYTHACIIHSFISKHGFCKLRINNWEAASKVACDFIVCQFLTLFRCMWYVTLYKNIETMVIIPNRS